MSYLVLEISGWLVAATAIGFVSAWLLRRGDREQVVRSHSIAESEVRAATNRAQQAEARIAALERELDRRTQSAERSKQAFGASQQKLESTEKRRRQLEEQLSMLERDLTSSHASLAETDRKLQERSDRANQLENDGEQQSALLASHESELARLRKARELIEHDLTQSRKLERELRADLDQTTTRLEQARTDLESAQRQSSDLESTSLREIADRDEQIGLLCQRIKELEPLEPIVERLQAQQRGQLTEIDSYRDEVDALRQRVEQLKQGPDDLKRIKGIGRVLERRLHEFGLRTYEDLARLEASQIEELGEQLGSKRKNDLAAWVEEARQLLPAAPN